LKSLGRGTRPNDLDQCIEFVRDAFLYDDSARADLHALWLELLTSDSGRSAVVFEAAVSAARFQDILVMEAPFISKSLLDDWRLGKKPFLDEAAFGSANAEDGLSGIGTGRRGTEILRHALRYVRDHPEELHAYSA
jgi:hypothetical protein